MFKKLRNRFLLMNMAIITFIMLVAFTAIYMITYQNVRRDIGMELQRVSEFYHKGGGPGKKDPAKASALPLGAGRELGSRGERRWQPGSILAAARERRRRCRAICRRLLPSHGERPSAASRTFGFLRAGNGSGMESGQDQFPLRNEPRLL